MAKGDQDLEALELVGSQLLAKLADASPAATEAVLGGMSAEQQRAAQEAIEFGRLNNRIR